MNGLQTIIACFCASTVSQGSASAHSEYHPSNPEDPQLRQLGECSWPDCLPRCEACPGRVLSSCLWSYVFPWVDCSKRHGPASSCFLSTCICEPGFCATEVHPGKMECTPMKCFPAGSTPPAQEEVYNSKWLLFWGGRDPFPDPDTLLSNPASYLLSIAVPWPMCVLVVGLVITCILIWRLCCNGEFKRLYEEEHQAEQRMYVQRGLELPPKKPNPLGLIILAVFIVTFTVITTVVKVVWSLHGYKKVSKSVLTLQEDAASLANEADRIQAQVNMLKTNISALAIDCGENWWLIGPQVENIYWQMEESIENYTQLVGGYTDMVGNIPDLLSDVFSFLRLQQDRIIWLPHVPLWLLASFCLVIIVYTLRILYLDHLPRCLGLRRLWQLAAAVFACILMDFAVLATVFFTLGIALSQFCLDPEYNARMYLSHLSNDSEVIGNITQHYLEGDVTNPILTYAAIATKYILAIRVIYNNFIHHIDWIESVCVATTGIELRPVFQTVMQAMDRARDVTDAHKIWSVYETVVRRTICHNAVDDLAVYTMALSGLGVVFVPACAITTNTYLLRWMKYKIWERKQYRDIKRDSDYRDIKRDSDTDEDTSSDSESELSIGITG